MPRTAKSQPTAADTSAKILRALKPFAPPVRKRIMDAVSANLALDEDAPLLAGQGEGRVQDIGDLYERGAKLRGPDGAA